MQKAHYSPPWAEVGIVGVAGSSGSGKTSLAHAIVAALNLPWVVIMSMDSFYKPLTPEQSAKAFRNEFDFDSPEAVDFDLLVQRLRDLKEGKRAEIPIYSFEKHSRLSKTNAIYSPHVLILEGIFALHDSRVRELLDLQIFAEADADLCLSRRLVRDVRERGRDIEGCIKQWFSFVKPNFHRYVEVQREVADIIVPRGIENSVAIGMIVDHVRKTLAQKSNRHQQQLHRLNHAAPPSTPLSPHVTTLPDTPQIKGLNTIILCPSTTREDLIFHFDRMASLLIERAASLLSFTPATVTTPQQHTYAGLAQRGTISAVILLRGGNTMEAALRRVFPDCRTGRVLIQTSFRTGEPELHYCALPPDVAAHSRVLLLDVQMSSGGAALMAVRVLVDHGVAEERIIFVTYFAGRQGLGRLMAVYPGIQVVVGRIGEDEERRWLEERYLGC